MSTNLLPQNTFLGKLELVETFSFYDKPVLFTARSASDHLYLVLWVDETAQADVWLYVSISRARLEQLRLGAVDLNHAFREAEDAFVFEVHTPSQADQSARIRSLSIDTLSDDQLPEPGEYLSAYTAAI